MALKKKRKAPVKKSRAYNSQNRQSKSEESQKLVLDTYIRLLVARKGAEVSVAEISEASGVSERSIFRFFTDKSALHEATIGYLGSYLSATVHQLDELDLFDFITQTFTSFDRNENLMMAYVLSPFGQEVRAVFRKQFNQLLKAKIRKQFAVKNNAATNARLALVVSLVNAKLWYDIRSDYQLSGEEIGNSVSWAVRALIKNIDS